MPQHYCRTCERFICSKPKGHPAFEDPFCQERCRHLAEMIDDRTKRRFVEPRRKGEPMNLMEWEREGITEWEAWRAWCAEFEKVAGFSVNEHKADRLVTLIRLWGAHLFKLRRAQGIDGEAFVDETITHEGRI